MTNKSLAKTYFRKFGVLKKITFRKMSRTIIAEYDSEKSLHNALQNAGEYKSQHFTVSTEKKTSPVKKKSILNNPVLYTDDTDVQAELDGMAGGPSITRSNGLLLI